MMPSKYRGRVDIWINGAYWAGAIIGPFASLIFLNAFSVDVLAARLPDSPVLALVVIIVGRTLPESPRRLMTHGWREEAETELAKIDDNTRQHGQVLEPVDKRKAISLVPGKQYGYLTFLQLVFRGWGHRDHLRSRLRTHVAPADKLPADVHRYLAGDKGPACR
jgi:hypothetical protein